MKSQSFVVTYVTLKRAPRAAPHSHDRGRGLATACRQSPIGIADPPPPSLIGFCLSMRPPYKRHTHSTLSTRPHLSLTQPPLTHPKPQRLSVTRVSLITPITHQGVARALGLAVANMHATASRHAARLALTCASLERDPAFCEGCIQT